MINRSQSKSNVVKKEENAMAEPQSSLLLKKQLGGEYCKLDKINFVRIDRLDEISPIHRSILRNVEAKKRCRIEIDILCDFSLLLLLLWFGVESKTHSC